MYRAVSTVNKQINDKERIAAAMENPNLRQLVENCIKEEEWKTEDWNDWTAERIFIQLRSSGCWRENLLFISSYVM